MGSEIRGLVKTATGFGSPELVDDGPSTAPSKRIAAAVPEYAKRKASAGPIFAAKIGLPVLAIAGLAFPAVAPAAPPTPAPDRDDSEMFDGADSQQPAAAIRQGRFSG
ncbi:MAG: DUF4276 family protein, partial [Gemmatimonadetes bacterium]|nr:DUF4276 family protein [Gemmatimonadota bacterium]